MALTWGGRRAEIKVVTTMVHAKGEEGAQRGALKSHCAVLHWKLWAARLFGIKDPDKAWQSSKAHCGQHLGAIWRELRAETGKTVAGAESWQCIHRWPGGFFSNSYILKWEMSTCHWTSLVWTSCSKSAEDQSKVWHGASTTFRKQLKMNPSM